MKRILLIITIIFLIFQTFVLATVIEIGEDAIDRDSTKGGDYTIVNIGGQANATGKITKIYIWSYSSLTNVDVATFFVVSGNNLSTRDYEFIGDVPGGSLQSFDVDIDVEEGDCIGMYWAGSTKYMETSLFSHSGYWRAIMDQIPCTDITFAVVSGDAISLCGTGTTEVEEANAISFGTDF